jgi:hypothetical protein
VRRSISTFSKLTDLESRLASLRDDLASGDWHAKHGHLLAEEARDLGYRLILAG